VIIIRVGKKNLIDPPDAPVPEKRSDLPPRYFGAGPGHGPGIVKKSMAIGCFQDCAQAMTDG
jgi:hypothetical protein